MSELYDEFGKLEEYLNQNIKDEFSEYMLTKTTKVVINMEDVLSKLDKHFEDKFASKVSGS